MDYNRLGNTGLEISSLGLGTWVFGGDNWQGSDEQNSLRAVHAALDNGINLIDTAPIYGNGRSEKIVGEAVKDRRGQVIIATKCGLVTKGNKIQTRLSRKSILQEVAASLKRLQTDYIDLYQCHWPDPETPMEETVSTLVELVREGKIRHFGVSNFDKQQIAQALDNGPIASLQSEYSLLNREIEKEILPFCREKGVSLLAYGPLAGGILTGKYKQEPHFEGSDARNFFYKHYQGRRFKEVQQFIKELEKHGRPLNQIAINWVRQQEGVAAVLVGCRNSEQVLDNIKTCSWSLTEQELSDINNM